MRNASCHVVVLLIYFGLTLLSGCTYHWDRPGQGVESWAYPRAQTPGPRVALLTLENQTLEPLLSEEVTPVLRQVLLRDGRLVLSSRTRAEWVLEGAITAYREEPLAFDAQQQAQLYRMFVSLEARLRRMGSREILWQGTLQTQTEYAATSDVMATRWARRQALAEAARNLAEELVDRITAGW